MRVKVTSTFKGTGAVERLIEEGLKEAVTAAVTDLQGEAQREAPKDEGTLRASADHEIGEVTGAGSKQTITGSVTFDVPYAAKQHEEESYQHSVGKAKYLYDPMQRKGPSYLALMSGIVRRKLGGGL